MSSQQTCCCRAMGMQSLPVAFGVDTAKWICAASIDVTQLSVAAYLFAGLHENIYAAVLLALVLPQVSPIDICNSLADTRNWLVSVLCLRPSI